MDVFVSMVWNTSIHHRASQSYVSYPDSRLTDEIEDGHGDLWPSWIQGWNMVTDLYRILEEVLVDARPIESSGLGGSYAPPLASSFQRARLSLRRFFGATQVVLDGLHPVFRLDGRAMLQSVSGSGKDDIYGFQAANVGVTLQVCVCLSRHKACIADRCQALRLKLVTSDPSNSFTQTCQVAEDMLDVLRAIPTTYMRAISVPFVSCSKHLQEQYR